jgi:outer membrane protein
MKNLLLVFALLAGTLFNTTAQKIAVVDINKILSDMPDYQKAQADLDKVAADWRQEIAQQYDEIKSMYNKYQAEQVLLSDDVKKQREEEIMDREKEVREVQKRKFGPEGELFLMRRELVNPIQEKVFNAIEQYALESSYDLILDKAGSAGVLFASEQFDKTELIKRRLSIR